VNIGLAYLGTYGVYCTISQLNKADSIYRFKLVIIVFILFLFIIVVFVLGILFIISGIISIIIYSVFVSCIYNNEDGYVGGRTTSNVNRNMTICYTPTITYTRNIPNNNLYI